MRLHREFPRFFECKTMAVEYSGALGGKSVKSVEWNQREEHHLHSTIALGVWL